MSTTTLALALGLLLALPCCGSVTSTTGTAFERSFGGDAAGEAVIDSASHDIPCPAHAVHVVDHAASDGSTAPVIAVEGCGERLTYMIGCDGDCRAELIARMKTP